MKRQRNISARTIGDPEPGSAGDEFTLRWLKRLGSAAVLERIRSRAFGATVLCRSAGGSPLIESLFDHRSRDSESGAGAEGTWRRLMRGAVTRSGSVRVVFPRFPRRLLPSCLSNCKRIRAGILR